MSDRVLMEVTVEASAEVTPAPTSTTENAASGNDKE